MLKKSSFTENEVSVTEYAEKIRQKMSALPTVSDASVLALIEKEVLNDALLANIDILSKKRLVRSVFCTLRCELEILQDLADDPEVSEIMVNGTDNVFVEKNGRILKTDIRFENQKQLERIIRRLAAEVSREMNDLNPIVDARLKDGSRINAVYSNIAINGPVLTIRKFTKNRMSMEDYIASGGITKDAGDLLKTLVECRYNIFVCGGTSSGKTTFLNVLSDYIPDDERIVVIEDSAELQIRNHENLVRMETKSANAQGKGAVEIRDLLKTSLRMRPDRVIVGEVRGPEVIDMLAAMSTGHDGSLSTGHSNSAEGMLRRLESLYISGSDIPLEAVRAQIASSLDILVHLSRDRSGMRRVMEISELGDYEDGKIRLNSLYKYDPKKGLVKTGSSMQRTEKLERCGRLHEI